MTHLCVCVEGTGVMTYLCVKGIEVSRDGYVNESRGLGIDALGR